MSTTISELRKVPIENIVEKLGGQYVGTGSGKSLQYTSPLRDEKKGSLYVYPNNNKWNDFGHVGRKSGDGLDLICEYLKEQGKPHSPKEGLSYAGELFRGLDVNQPIIRRAVVDNSNKIVINQVRDQLSPSTLNYVKGRGISSMGIVRNHLKQVHFHFEQTPDRKWYAAGFPSDKGGYEVRGAAGNFEIKYGVGTKSITTLPGTDPKGSVAIFEGFFDYLTQLQRDGLSAPRNDTIILNTNNMINEAIDHMKDKGYKSIDLYKQNDGPGKKVLTALQEAYPGLSINDKSPAYKEFKDYNEFHINAIKIQTPGYSKKST